MRRAALLLAALGALAAGQDPDPPTVGQLGLEARKGILHCHSHLSHDSEGTPARIVAAARATGVDFIAMTDHPSPGSLGPAALRGLHDGVLFLAGAETRQILAVDLERPLTAGDTAGAIAETKAQGGLAFLAHPEEIDDWEPLGGATGMEVYNLHSDIKDEEPAHLALRGLAAYLRDPETCYYAFFDRPTSFLDRWDRLTRTRRVVGVAGNDAHENIRWGRIQADPYERTFRFVATYALVDARVRPLTGPAVLEALAAGRAFVGFGGPGDPRAFSFTARAAAGPLTMGDEAAVGEGEPVRFAVEAPAEGRIVLVVDGVPRAEATGRRLSRTIAGPAVVRVEVYRNLDGVERLWVLSNPIYLRPRP